MVVSKLSAKEVIFNWPDDAKEMAQRVTNKYGEPDEVASSMLIWHNNRPWKRTIVYRNSVRHNFPLPHQDIIEQVINHEVPMEKACELAAFDGSVVINRTRGEISVCCQDEAVNFLALNLAHDIIRDKKTFEQARRIYLENMIAYRQHKLTPYMGRLRFRPENDRADPDESITSEMEMGKSAAEDQAEITLSTS